MVFSPVPLSDVVAEELIKMGSTVTEVTFDLTGLTTWRLGA